MHLIIYLFVWLSAMTIENRVQRFFAIVLLLFFLLVMPLGSILSCMNFLHYVFVCKLFALPMTAYYILLICRESYVLECVLCGVKICWVGFLLVWFVFGRSFLSRPVVAFCSAFVGRTVWSTAT